MRAFIIICLSAVILSSTGILVYELFIHKEYVPPKAEQKTVVIYWDSGGEKKEETIPYQVVFQEVNYDGKKTKTDTKKTPDGYNGSYIETDDNNLINYAAKPLSGKTFVTSTDVDLITMSDREAWELITGGRFSSFPNSPYREIKDQLLQIQYENRIEMTFKVWYWENPFDESNFNKVTREATWTVHKEIASLWEHIFEDIYNDPSKPVINIADAGAGTWVLRGKGHDENRTLSAHALGTCIDINPSTAVTIGGERYGNAYGAKAMPAALWEALPESHSKHYILYEDSPVVQIFKSYGFYWGGDWSGSASDPMHFAFLGDGSGRKAGYENYLKYRR